MRNWSVQVVVDTAYLHMVGFLEVAAEVEAMVQPIVAVVEGLIYL
jgi:hypothetical protein